MIFITILLICGITVGFISISLMLYNANIYSNYSGEFNWEIFYKCCSIKILWKVSSIRRHSNDVNVIFYVAKWSSFFAFLIEANVISVPVVLKRSLFKKNRTGIWSFFHYQERWCLSPENMILFFRRKMKDVLSQKISGNMIFSIYLV